MPVRFDNRDGLKLHIIQLNGTLSVRFTSKAHRLTEQVFQGTDAGTTEQTNAAHETAIGELLLLQGLEMYVEQVQGHLRMSFESEVGNRTTIMLFDRTGNAMSEEMLEQFLEPTPRQEPVKDKVRRGLMREVSAPKEERVPVDLGEEEDEMLKNEEDDEDEHKEENDAAPTNPLWSEGVLSVFSGFDERTLLERPAEGEIYRHIFMEGYRTGTDADEGHNEEGRLHVDFNHQELIWESCDEHDGGTRLKLDRIRLPACVINTFPLKPAHFFGDHTLQLWRASDYDSASPVVVFSMDFKTDGQVYGSDTGTGPERFYFTGENRTQIAIEAVKRCLETRRIASSLGVRYA